MAIATPHDLANASIPHREAILGMDTHTEDLRCILLHSLHASRVFRPTTVSRADRCDGGHCSPSHIICQSPSAMNHTVAIPGICKLRTTRQWLAPFSRHATATPWSSCLCNIRNRFCWPVLTPPRHPLTEPIACSRPKRFEQHQQQRRAGQWRRWRRWRWCAQQPGWPQRPSDFRQWYVGICGRPSVRAVCIVCSTLPYIQCCCLDTR